MIYEWLIGLVIPRRLLALLGSALTPLLVCATENGTTAFPNGGEDLQVAAMPPPGWYGILYLNHYSADEVTDDSGQMFLPAFDLKVNAVTPRLDWVKPVSVLGSDRWGTMLVIPWLDLDLAVEPIPGTSVHAGNRGFGDLTIGNGLHWTLRDFEMVNAIDVVVPIGKYDSASLVNPGRNQWVIRLNHMGTWFPAPSWDLSYRLHWDYNFRNEATDYLSGQTVYLNWAIGWKPVSAVSVGVVGFVLRQVTDDQDGDQSAGPDGNRLEAFGIGPVVKYAAPHGVMYTLKYLRDFDVRNRPQGDQFWLYGAFRF